MTNILFQLFIVFFKIGAFTFGGGWAMISIIEKEIVDKKHWVTKEEFLDFMLDLYNGFHPEENNTSKIEVPQKKIILPK